jgi:hypothetical protein
VTPNRIRAAVVLSLLAPAPATQAGEERGGLPPAHRAGLRDDGAYQLRAGTRTTKLGGNTLVIDTNKSPANRTNALHPTGPRTPGGRANSARNAPAHGLSAAAVVPALGESPEGLAALAAEVRTALRPVASSRSGRPTASHSCCAWAASAWTRQGSSVQESAPTVGRNASASAEQRTCPNRGLPRTQ